MICKFITNTVYVIVIWLPLACQIIWSWFLIPEHSCTPVLEQHFLGPTDNVRCLLSAQTRWSYHNFFFVWMNMFWFIFQVTATEKKESRPDQLWHNRQTSNVHRSKKEAFKCRIGVNRSRSWSGTGTGREVILIWALKHWPCLWFWGPCLCFYGGFLLVIFF